MDALFEKLDRLSSPIGGLLDKALARLAPQTTAAAICDKTCGCPGREFCGARCNTGPVAMYELYYVYRHNCGEDCSTNGARCSIAQGCLC